MQTFWQDLRYGARMLRKNPGLTLIAVMTLAMGIGATTAIFSVVNATLLRPLPFQQPERLALFWGSKPGANMPQLPLSLPNFDDIRAQCQSCESLSAWTLGHANLTRTNLAQANLAHGAEPERVQYAIVSADFFTTLGVQPLLGRAFRAEEDNPGNAPAALVSHSLWRRRFGADPALVGSTITLDGQSREVCGVLPEGFRFASFPKETEIWLPFGLDPFKDRKYARGARALGAIARLKPGVSLAAAQAELDAIARRLEQAEPFFNTGWRLQAVGLGEQASGKLRRGLLVLLGAVAFLLLIACVNVANLQLARAAARRRELAIRAALGAGRFRIAQQLLVESLLLALLGGGAGALLAWWGVDLFALIPYNAPNPFTPYTVAPEQIGIDGRVLGFTGLLALLTGMLFGLAPALQMWKAAKANLPLALKESGARAGGAMNVVGRGRGLLVVAEVALALALLIGAGLMIRSFARLQQVEPGFDPRNVLTFDLNLPESKYERPQAAQFYERLLERLAAAPGVISAGAVEFLPLSGLDGNTGLLIEGRPEPAPSERIFAHHRVVTPDYFRAMGMRLRQGRAFTAADNDKAPRVAIINETMARRYWPGEIPIGKRAALDFEAMRFYPDRAPDRDLALGLREIVGVVADVKHTGLAGETVPEFYAPLAQRPAPNLTVVVRAKVDTAGLLDVARNEVRALDKDQPIANVSTMSEWLASSVAQPRFNFLLMTVFAAIALLLAALGIYGVMAWTVAQRTKEIGIRMALGAQTGDVLKMVIKRGMTLTLAGVALGLIASLALTRLMKTLLFNVSATDPLTFSLIASLLIAVAMLACYIPARRATKVDPMVALRIE
jgi:putative ABC transport system permease protein